LTRGKPAGIRGGGKNTRPPDPHPAATKRTFEPRGVKIAIRARAQIGGREVFIKIANGLHWLKTEDRKNPLKPLIQRGRCCT